MYQLTNNQGVSLEHPVLKNTGEYIPPDPGNIHYQEYLAWLAEGNTPDPAPDHSDSVADHPDRAE